MTEPTPIVDWNSILPLIGLIIGPIVTGAVKRILPSIPKMILPLLSTVAGAIAASLAGADGHTAALIGGASVATRESLDQTLKSGVVSGLKLFSMLLLLAVPLFPIGARAQTNTPTQTPTSTPTRTPTVTPTGTPTNTPTETPTFTPTYTPDFDVRQPSILHAHATCSSTPCNSRAIEVQDGHKTIQVGIEGTATVKVQCCAIANTHFLPCTDLTSLSASGVYTTDAVCKFRTSITACTGCRVSSQIRSDPD